LNPKFNKQKILRLLIISIILATSVKPVSASWKSWETEGTTYIIGKDNNIMSIPTLVIFSGSRYGVFIIIRCISNSSNIYEWEVREGHFNIGSEYITAKCYDTKFDNIYLLIHKNDYMFLLGDGLFFIGSNVNTHTIKYY